MLLAPFLVYKNLEFFFQANNAHDIRIIREDLIIPVTDENQQPTQVICVEDYQMDRSGKTFNWGVLSEVLKLGLEWINHRA